MLKMLKIIGIKKFKINFKLYLISKILLNNFIKVKKNLLSIEIKIKTIILNLIFYLLKIKKDLFLIIKIKIYKIKKIYNIKIDKKIPK